MRLGYQFDRRTTPHTITDPRHPLHNAGGNMTGGSEDNYASPVKAVNRAFATWACDELQSLTAAVTIATTRRRRFVAAPMPESATTATRSSALLSSGEARAATHRLVFLLTAPRLLPSAAVRNGGSSTPDQASGPGQGESRVLLSRHVQCLSGSFSGQEQATDPFLMSGKDSVTPRRFGPAVARSPKVSDDDQGVSLSARGVTTSTLSPKPQSRSPFPATEQRYGGLGSVAFHEWLRVKVHRLLVSIIPLEAQLSDEDEHAAASESNETPHKHPAAPLEDDISWNTPPPLMADAAVSTPRDDSAMPSDTGGAAAPDVAGNFPTGAIPCVSSGSKVRRSKRLPQQVRRTGPKPVNPSGKFHAGTAQQVPPANHRTVQQAKSLLRSMHVDESFIESNPLLRTVEPSTALVAVGMPGCLPQTVLPADEDLETFLPLERLLPVVRTRSSSPGGAPLRTPSADASRSSANTRAQSALATSSARSVMDTAAAVGALLPLERRIADLRAHTPLLAGWQRASRPTSSVERGGGGDTDGQGEMRSTFPTAVGPARSSTAAAGPSVLAEAANRLKRKLQERGPPTQGTPGGAHGDNTPAQRGRLQPMRATQDPLPLAEGVAAALATVTCPASRGPIGVNVGMGQLPARPVSRSNPLPCGFKLPPSRLQSTRPFS
jgi:hypothetical protein